MQHKKIILENRVSIVSTLFRLIVGTIWIVAGAIKITHPAESVRAVRAYKLLPEPVVPIIGHLLPTLEIVVGTLLIIGLILRPAAILSILMFIAFITGISLAWARGLQIDCGCFGGGGYDPDAANKYPKEILRDVGLLLITFYIIWKPVGPKIDKYLFSENQEPDGQ